MRRTVLYLLGVYFLLTAIYIFFAPQKFYDLTPGLSAMGPFNLHFIRDVSFAFFVSGGALLYGARHHKKDVLIIGAGWPFLHALFHAYIWGHRGFPFDQIWAFDLVAVVLPGLIALGLAFKTTKSGGANDNS